MWPWILAIPAAALAILILALLLVLRLGGSHHKEEKWQKSH
jgi:hypothetical protein